MGRALARAYPAVDGVSVARGRSPARRAAPAPRADLRPRLASPRAPAPAPRRSAAARAGAVAASGNGPWRKAIFPTHRQPRCALTRSTMSRARWLASMAKAQSMRSTSVAGARGAVGIGLGAARRPVEPLETGEAGDSSPTISGQCDTRPVSLKPRAASAGPTRAPRCAPSRVAKGFFFSARRLEAFGHDRQSSAFHARRQSARLVRPPPPRNLPWRAAPGEAADPYRVWLSEILLQQTTTAGAAPYYREFLRRWPDVDALAAAPLEEVMSAFAGLGYYSRARNLHACAQAVAAAGGAFPSDEAGLRALPGIGPYTAAAVAAIAFDRPATPIDGNIARIVSRLAGFAAPIAVNRRAIEAFARTLTPPRRAGDFAQALMDIGATICRPKRARLPDLPVARGLPRRRERRPRGLSRPDREEAAARESRRARSSPSARTAPSSPAAARRRGCSARRWSCRAGRGGRARSPRSTPARRPSPRPGAGFLAASSMCSRISRCGSSSSRRLRLSRRRRVSRSSRPTRSTPPAFPA